MDPTDFANPRKELNKADIREKCHRFRDRGLSYDDISERLAELYGVKVSKRMVGYYLSGER
jgi:hypothetical protein